MNKIILVMFFLFSHFAFADIQDRINQCEESGDNSCVFNLLREISLKSSGSSGLQNNKCTIGTYIEPSCGGGCDNFLIIHTDTGEIYRGPKVDLSRGVSHDSSAFKDVSKALKSLVESGACL